MCWGVPGSDWEGGGGGAAPRGFWAPPPRPHGAAKPARNHTCFSRGLSGDGFEQRRQTARAIERGEVVITADMRLADVHLRHCPTARARHHFLTAGGAPAA